MRNTLFAALLLMTLGAGCAPEERTEPEPPPKPTVILPAEFEPIVTEVESATAVPALPAREERVVAPPQPYLPPPSVNLTGGMLGRQRVPGMDNAGDVHQLYYHTPSLTLFAAVTEPDGLRSVWKVPFEGTPERVFAASGGAGEIRIHGDSKGVIYVQHDNPSRLYRSDDGLKNWRLVLDGHGLFWGIADDGKGNVYGTTHDWNSAVLYRSPNDGFNWEPWIDFQRLFPQFAVRYDENDDRFKLRHLHDVIYDQAREQLIVGTGDVARFALMTEDGGAIWTPVWDEGFTAHVRMSGGFRYLLGPDQLHGHGIALYDAETKTSREVWNPIPFGYAGYVYSLLNVNGIYYAAIHTEKNEAEEVVPKFGVIVSPDGETWYKFLEWGPLGHHARTDVWLAGGPNVVYASLNGVLYAFRPLEPEWFGARLPLEP